MRQRAPDPEAERSPSGEHEGEGTRFYGSRDFGWYGGHGRGSHDFGTSREFEREDYERPGMHDSPPRDLVGREPQGDERSDERIRGDVRDCLMKDAEVDASAIEAEVRDGIVILNGTVDSLGAKHRVENLCEWVSGVQGVANYLRLKSEGGSPAS